MNITNLRVRTTPQTQHQYIELSEIKETRTPEEINSYITRQPTEPLPQEEINSHVTRQPTEPLPQVKTIKSLDEVNWRDYQETVIVVHDQDTLEHEAIKKFFNIKSIRSQPKTVEPGTEKEYIPVHRTSKSIIDGIPKKDFNKRIIYTPSTSLSQSVISSQKECICFKPE